MALVRTLRRTQRRSRLTTQKIGTPALSMPMRVAAPQYMNPRYNYSTHRYYSQQQTDSVQNEQEIDPEDTLPPELQELRPISTTSWIVLVAICALAAFVIPWGSWAEHIFADDDDDD
eukprot:TRINITY_DN5221_c0_g1_i1.p1 TRINITY_DN5221_c0_g1~~TRINITY_DN5221_c0_g1_i1.p1  ORF type:complete len:130 (-),score=24.04 TRINITY_DN5221_c0_g1_i1:36-386(-)